VSGTNKELLAPELSDLNENKDTVDLKPEVETDVKEVESAKNVNSVTICYVLKKIFFNLFS